MYRTTKTEMPNKGESSSRAVRRLVCRTLADFLLDGYQGRDPDMAAKWEKKKQALLDKAPLLNDTDVRFNLK